MGIRTIKARKPHYCTNCLKPTEKNELVRLQEVTHFLEYEDGKTIIHKERNYIHIKCHEKALESSKRFEEFKKTCEHPKDFTVTHYSYIPGEAVKEPSHDECTLCGAWF